MCDFASIIYQKNIFLMTGGNSSLYFNPTTVNEAFHFKIDEQTNQLKVDKKPLPNLRTKRAFHSCIIINDFLFVLFGR